MVDVAAGEPPLALEIRRRHHLARDDQAADAGHVAVERGEHRSEQPGRRRPTSLRAGCAARTAHRSTSRARLSAPASRSAIDGISTSSHGDGDQRPYFTSSKARSIASMSGAMRSRVASCSRSAPGTTGRADSARFTFTSVPRCGSCARASGLRRQRHRIAERVGRFRIDAETTAPATIARPSARCTPVAASPSVTIPVTRTLVTMATPACSAARLSAVGKLPGPPLGHASRGVAGHGIGRVQEEQQAAARGPRAEHAAEDAVGGERGGHDRRLDVLRDEVGHRHRAPTQQPITVARPRRTECRAVLQQAPQLASAPGHRSRAASREDRGHDASERRARGHERGPAVGVLGLKRAQAWPHGRGRATTSPLVLAVERGHPGIAGDQLETVRVEAQIARDIGAQRPDIVRRGGHEEAGREFAGHGRRRPPRRGASSTRDLAAGARQQRGAHQAVDTAADRPRRRARSSCGRPSGSSPRRSGRARP